MKKIGPDLLFVLVITASLSAMLVVGLLWGFEDQEEMLPPPTLPGISAPPEDMAPYLADRLNRVRDGNSSKTNQEIAVLLESSRLDPEGFSPGGSSYDALKSLGEAAVPALVVRLAKGRPLEREGAARLLGELASPLAVGFLAHGLDDEAYAVQACCAEALGRIGDRSAVADLIRWDIRLTPKEGIVKVRVAEALCALGCSRGVSGLIRALTGEIFFIRIALAALRRFTEQNFEMDAYALRALREERAAEWATWWHANRLGFKLKNTVEDNTDPRRLAWCVSRELKRTGENRYYYMQQAKKVLAGMGAMAVPYLLHALYAGHPEEAYHESYEVRLGAAHVFELLGRAGADVRDAPRHLEAVMGKDANHSVRAQTAASLGWCGDRRSVPSLLRALAEDKDLSVRIEAAMSLGRLRFTDGGEPLSALCQKGGLPHELAMEIEVARELIRGGTGVTAMVKALERGLSGSDAQGDEGAMERLAERAHQRLVEVTGRIPKGAETLAQASEEKRAAVVAGWRRTQAKWELLRGLRDALSHGDRTRANTACDGLKKAYSLDPQSLPKDPGEAYSRWTALVGIWLRFEAMARALEGGDLLTYQALRTEFNAYFGVQTEEHPGMRPDQRRAALHTLMAWAEKVDPF